ncbi:diiron oxygenase [Actinomadura barringtoniae]|uniref:Diiron oxygenase n=1 Tax=Actinomadura barringtoniae TaxID=1427535 RepID=A0A939P9J4_9ACTN|nr:diiron oxygenase [Actinomadura barringtoniae]MBO2448511.1 diiron oxygenase [Actinomadura barringtoniae]
MTTNSLRIERLNKASTRKFIEPDAEVTGAFTKDQLVPDELLSVAGLDLDLSPEQRARLAREELASIFHAGVMFEQTLIAGFAFQMALGADITDPRFTYALHEIGEETRHSRLFIRVYRQLEPEQRNPFIGGRVPTLLSRWGLPLLMKRAATLDAFVLAGEEIPDLLQKLLAEHPDTDPYIGAVNRYHRAEEARHIAFARTTLGEHYAAATWSDRLAVRWIVPLAIVAMFDLTMIQPYVYETVGLPVWRTWRQVRRLPRRVELRRQCARTVLKALTDAGVFRAESTLPYPWRRITR